MNWGTLFIFVAQFFLFSLFMSLLILILKRQALFWSRNVFKEPVKEKQTIFALSSQVPWNSGYLVEYWGRGHGHSQGTHRWTSSQARIPRITGLLFVTLIPYACCSQRHPSLYSLLPLEVPEYFLHTSKGSVPSNSLQTATCSPGAVTRVWERRIMLLWSFAPDNLLFMWWTINSINHDSLLNLEDKWHWDS